jgi:hypothetical protein
MDQVGQHPRGVPQDPAAQHQGGGSKPPGQVNGRLNSDETPVHAVRARVASMDRPLVDRLPDETGHPGVGLVGQRHRHRIERGQPFLDHPAREGAESDETARPGDADRRRVVVQGRGHDRRRPAGDLTEPLTDQLPRRPGRDRNRHIHPHPHDRTISRRTPTARFPIRE